VTDFTHIHIQMNRDTATTHATILLYDSALNQHFELVDEEVDALMALLGAARKRHDKVRRVTRMQRLRDELLALEQSMKGDIDAG